jgi:hypothetical protein
VEEIRGDDSMEETRGDLGGGGGGDLILGDGWMGWGFWSRAEAGLQEGQAAGRGARALAGVERVARGAQGELVLDAAHAVGQVVGVARHGGPRRGLEAREPALEALLQRRLRRVPRERVAPQILLPAAPVVAAPAPRPRPHRRPRVVLVLVLVLVLPVAITVAEVALERRDGELDQLEEVVIPRVGVRPPPAAHVARVRHRIHGLEILASHPLLNC